LLLIAIQLVFASPVHLHSLLMNFQSCKIEAHSFIFFWNLDIQ